MGRKYVRLFLEFKVTGKQLLALSNQQLQSLGVMSDPHRKRILDELKKHPEINARPAKSMANKLVTNMKPELRSTRSPSRSSSRSSGSLDRNRLFEIRSDLTSLEIRDQIKDIKGYMKKLRKSRRKQKRRIRCVATIEKLESLLEDVLAVESAVEAPLFKSSPADIDGVNIEEPKNSNGNTPKLVEEQAFKTPRSTSDSFSRKFQDSMFKDSDENAFTTTRKNKGEINLEKKEEK